MKVWDDSSSDISDAPLDFDPPMIANSPSSRGQAIARWILRFLMVIPDIVIDHFLRFFAVIFTILLKLERLYVYKAKYWGHKQE